MLVNITSIAEFINEASNPIIADPTAFNILSAGLPNVGTMPPKPVVNHVFSHHTCLQLHMMYYI